MAAGTEVGRISIRVMPDTDKFRSDLKRELEEIERTVKAEVEVRAVLDRSYLATQLFKLKKDLAAKRLTVTIDVEVDESALNRLGRISDTIQGAAGGGGGGRRRRSLMPSFGGGINAAGYVVILGLITALLAPLMGLITSALLTLPGLIAMVTAPIAALALGFDGLKEAAKSIKEPFEGLKKTLSDSAKDTFTPVFESLGESIPMLERSLPSVTAGMAKLSQGIADTLKTPANSAMLEETINNIGAAIGNAQPGMDGFVNGFVRLANVFSEQFPGLVEWFNGAGTAFDNWIAKMDQTGELDTAFGNLGDTLKELLETLGQLALDGMDFISDPSKWNGFQESLEGILGTLEGISAASKAIADVWDVLNYLGSSVKEIVSNPTTGFDKVFGPAIFGGEGGARDWRKLADDTAAGVDSVKASVDQIPPSAEAAGAALGEMFSASTTEGQDLLGDLRTQLVEGAPLEPPPVEAPNTEPAKAQVAEYQAFVDNVTNQVRGSLAQATSGESLPAPNFEAFKSAWSGLPGFVSTTGEQVKSAAAAALSGTETAFTESGGRIVAEVSTWPGKISGALGGLHAAGYNAGIEVGNGMAAGISAGSASVTAAARSLAAQAAAAARAELDINSPSRVFEEIGGHTAAGFAVGIKSGFKPVIGLAQDLSRQVTEAFLTNQGMGDSMASVIASGGVADQIRMQEQELEAEQELLDIEKLRADIAEKKAGSDEEKERAKAVSDALDLRQDELDLQKMQLELTKKETKAQSDLNKEYGQLLGKALGVPVDFVEAAGDQFMSDLGFSSDGLFPTLLTEGTKYIFNINGVDEALAIKQREQNKEALQFNRR